MEKPTDITLNSNEKGNKTESEIRTADIEYHGRTIRIIASEHSNIEIGGKEYPEYNIYLPGSWKDEIDHQIGDPSVIFTEYYIPDLQKSAFREPLVGLLVRKWAKDNGIANYFDSIGRMAGKRGCPIAVADPANSSLYMYHEAIGMRNWKQETETAFPNIPWRPYDGHGSIPDAFDFEIANAVDSRRLMTARALMQEVLRIKSVSKTGPDVVLITPPAHAIRIEAYIQRQKDAELLPDTFVHEPNDFITCGQKRDIEKAKIYKGMLGLNTNIRYYHPTQEKYHYTLAESILISDYEKARKILESANESTRTRILIKIIDKIESYKDQYQKGVFESIFKKLVDTKNSWYQKSIKAIY